MCVAAGEWVVVFQWCARPYTDAPHPQTHPTTRTPAPPHPQPPHPTHVRTTRTCVLTMVYEPA